MYTVPTHASHRKAFGPKHRRSEATKARDVAESMFQHEIEGDPYDWQQSYGIDQASPYGQLIKALLIAKRAQERAS